MKLLSDYFVEISKRLPRQLSVRIYQGMAFLIIHTYFFVNWLTILVCLIMMFIFTTIFVASIACHYKRSMRSLRSFDGLEGLEGLDDLFFSREDIISNVLFKALKVAAVRMNSFKSKSKVTSTLIGFVCPKNRTLIRKNDIKNKNFRKIPYEFLALVEH